MKNKKAKKKVGKAAMYTASIEVCLTNKQKASIKAAAKKAGTTISDFVRSKIA